MILESTILLVLINIIFFIYLRFGKPAMAVSVLFLSLLPLLNLIGAGVSPMLPNAMTQNEWQMLFVVVGMTVSSVFYGIVSQKIEKVSYRRMYLFLCCGFTLAFGFLILLKLFTGQM